MDVAEEYLKRSVELFATDAPKPGEPSWGKAEAFAWLGQVYEKKGDKTKAAEMYKTALDVEPELRDTRNSSQRRSSSHEPGLIS